MKTHSNLIYIGIKQKKALYDLFLPNTTGDKPTIIFIHGYMGYKDWGAWNLAAQAWCKSGFPVATMNLSHNGTTIENPTQFTNFDDFAQATYYNDLQEINLFIDHLKNTHHLTSYILVGHSRGGALAILAGKHQDVRQIHCLAPISSLSTRFPTGIQLEKWKQETVFYRKNGRTQQDMPHHYNQFINFLAHQEELDIEKACKSLNKKVFVYHGDKDSSVAPEEGKKIAAWSGGIFYLIADTNHTFDSREPWTESTLPPKMNEIVQQMSMHFDEAI